MSTEHEHDTPHSHEHVHGADLEDVHDHSHT